MLFEDILFGLIPDHLTLKMYNKAVRNNPWLIGRVPDNVKTHGICDKAIEDDPSFLQFIPDWFVTRVGIDMWCDGCYDGKDKLIEFTDNKDNFIE